MGLRIEAFEELEAQAAARFREEVAQAPRPKVANILAALTVTAGQSREFPWGTVSYRAPPLSYPVGLRLLVAAEALRDLREQGASPAVRQEAVRTVAAVLATACQVVGGPWLDRLIRKRAGFSRDDPDTIESLCFHLTHVPDEGAFVLPKKAVTLDLADTLAQFTRAFPSWCGRDGLPLSWAHYQYGSRHLTRASHREDLRAAIAFRVAAAPPKQYGAWQDEWLAIAGWA